MNDIQQLNKKYSVNNQVSFSNGEGDLPLIKISTDKARAAISLNGGQVISFKPVTSEQDLMFVSHNAYFQFGKAIKGGSPICWPWFAANPEDESLPFHGFVRNQLWQVYSTEVLDNGDTVIKLIFKDSDITRSIWPHQFELVEVITIGNTLDIELITKNTGAQPMSITQALHTYFNVGDITQVNVTGLENKTYLDKVDNFLEKEQTGPITVHGEVDRIYQNVDKPLCIHDEVLNRKILIAHTGSATAVVWNPWIDISRDSGDLEDDDYTRFICVETANAADDIVTIAPEEKYKIRVSYQIQS